MEWNLLTKSSSEWLFSGGEKSVSAGCRQLDCGGAHNRRARTV